MRRLAWMAWLAAVVAAGVGGPGRAAAAGGAAAPDQNFGMRLTFRERAHVVMHAWARAAVEGSAPDTPNVDGFDALVQASRALEKALGDARLWGLIDGRVVAAGSADEVVAAMEKLPREARMRDGTSRAFRDQAVTYAKQLKAVTEAFEKDGWKQLHARLKGVAQSVERMLQWAKPNAMAWIVAKMGWRLPEGGIEVPMDLVWAAPSPGGVTFRVPGGAASMVGVERVSGSGLAEVVLHEAMHAMDVVTGGMRGTKSAPPSKARESDAMDESDSALSRLRKAMSTAGIDPHSTLAHDAWHTLFFVTAGEAVRRCIDPGHADYGATHTYYKRMGPVADVEVREWGAYLRGEIGMDKAIEKIVAGLAGIERDGK